MKKRKKKIKKPDFVSQEQWQGYLNAIQDFGKNFVDVMTKTIKNVNEKMKDVIKKMPVDDLKLIRDEKDKNGKKK